MDKNISLDTQASKVSSQSIPQTIQDKVMEGLSNIKQGDMISGTVVAVDEQVTINFNGQQVTASKEVLKNTAPGEVKTFEVIKVSKTEIELKLLDKEATGLKQTFKAELIPNKDWETVLNQKEQNARLAEKEQLSKELMSKLQEISASFTESDCDILEQEGFPIETMTIKGLYQAISRVKFEQSKDNTSRETVPEKMTKEVIAVRLKEENLPVTDKNIREINKALTLSDTAGRMDDKTMRYLIDQEVTPTIENIYKAFYSGSKKSGEQKQELTETEWKELLPQVKAVIEDSGYEVNDENLQDAKWLIENKLPLTSKTFTYKKELDEIKDRVDSEMVLDRVLEGMKNGILPKNVSLDTQDEAALQQTITDIRSISLDAVSYAVLKGIELTIRKLAVVQKEINTGKIKPEEVQIAKAYTEKAQALRSDTDTPKAEKMNNEISSSEKLNIGISQVKNTSSESEAIKQKLNEGSAEPVSTELNRERQLTEESRTATKNMAEAVLAEEDTTGAKVDGEETETMSADRSTSKVDISYEKISKSKIEYNPDAFVRMEGHQDEVSGIASGAAANENTTSEKAVNDTDSSAPAETAGEKNAFITSSGEPASEDKDSNEGNTDADPHKQYEAVRSQRQLEEIRLKMTLEAASRLEKKGISIETQKLEKVVEELRKLENSYYKKLLEEAEVPLTTEAIETLKATSQSLEQLRTIPISAIGTTLSERGTQTIPSLLTEGLKLQSEYTKAGTAYETLMTVPNAEYGDSLRKAFSNMVSLLGEMNIENTEQNQRAIRILGYNQMDITTENIEQVKVYDSEVTALIKNLHPAVTVRMIKEGFNPMNMSISELNDKIDAIKEEQGITSEEKFSTYLHKLEKEEGITPEERKAYIGIYRLLYNVEKSDGAALGSVIKADREVTLSNLLTAVQTGKKGRLNAIVDDEFGTLTQMTRNKESIAEQLSGFMKGTSEQKPIREMILQKETQIEEQTRYLNRILKQITEELSPEKLSQLVQENSQTSTTGNTDMVGSTATAGNISDIWKLLKDVPAEQLLQKLQQETGKDTEADELHSQKVQQLRELCGKAEQSIRFLNDFQMSSTPQNITLANYILTNGASPIVRLIKRQNENDNENLTDSIKNFTDLSDTINDKSSMNEAYETLEEKARLMLESACSEETLDSRRLTELRSTAVQMSFLRTMAAREFYQIPIQTSKGITNINLTILRGGESGGRVSATVHSEQLGEVKADFSLKQQMLKGFISCDSRSGMEKLQANTGEIEKTAKDNDLILKQLDFGLSQRDNSTYQYQNPQNGQPNPEMDHQGERLLYRIAKAVVQTVRLAEDSDEEDTLAVS